MEKLKPQKKSRNRLKKAAAVFALAAVSFLAGYANWKCEGTEKKPAPVTQMIQRTLPKAETKTKEVLAKLEKALSAAERKNEAERTANEVLMKVVEEFPYQGLDCELKPLEEDVRFSEIDLDDKDDVIEKNEILWNQLKGSAGSALKDLLGNASQPYNKGVELMCRLGLIKSVPTCPTELIEEIKHLKDENQPEGVLSIVGYLNSLNIEWEQDPSLAGSNSTEEFEPSNLKDFYEGLHGRAHYDGWEKAPSLGCVAKNAYALKILRESVSVLGKLLAKNPNLVDSTLKQLPENQQESLYYNCMSDLFESDDFDRSNVENFFAALSPSTRSKFIKTLYDLYVNDEDQVARADELAKHASDPELRDAMSRIARRWKDKVVEAKKELEEEIKELEKYPADPDPDTGD